MFFINKQSLRVVSAEGRYSYYRVLREGKRLFLVLKLSFTSFQFFKNRGYKLKAKHLVYIKGMNQLRFHQYINPSLEEEFGKIDVMTSSVKKDDISKNQFPGFSLKELVWQITYLILLLLTGKKRYLSLYFLSFTSSIERVANTVLRDISTFICYNDQPYDVAAILWSLKTNINCRTITVQHGLILNHSFYFPANTQEFWGWGGLSLQHFRSKNPEGRLVIKGRYLSDKQEKKELLDAAFSSNIKRILIAPSFNHNEIKNLIREVYKVMKYKKITIAIKFHPATKFKFNLMMWMMFMRHAFVVESKNIEELASEYDALVTKNSTSSIDFFLKGKPVFFLSCSDGYTFPSNKYGYSINELKSYITGNLDLKEKNQERLSFLRNALNV